MWLVKDIYVDKFVPLLLYLDRQTFMLTYVDRMNDRCKLFVFLCLGVVETQLCDADVILGAAAEFCNHADQSEGGNVAEYSTITDRLV